MKTLDLFAAICFGFICLIAILVAILQNRVELLAIAFICGLVSGIALQEYLELRRKGE
jgi:branched-subunit amino acid permease